MPEDEDKLSEAFTGALGVVDVPVLRDYVWETSRWLIDEAIADQVPREQRHALAAEIADLVAAGLTPSLTTEIERNTAKVIAASQGEPVEIGVLGEMTVGGLTVPDVVRLIDAIGQMVDDGLGERLQTMHESHRWALFGAHDAWLRAKERKMGKSKGGKGSRRSASE